MASSRGMKGADYCISGGYLTRYTGCHWRGGAPLDRVQHNAKNAQMQMYMYASASAVYLLRVKDTFVNRRSDASKLIAEGPLATLWPDFIAYGRMTA